MMRNLRWFSAALATLALVACGGGSSSSSNCGSAFANSCGTTPGGTTAVVASLTASSSAVTIPADGSNPATITVVAKDANNNTLSGVTITFAATAGNLTVTQAITDTTGTAKATLTAGTAASGTAIGITATAGTVTGTVTVTVASIQQTLTLLTSAPQIPSDGSKSATISALIRDANNNVVPGVAVSFQASSGSLAVTQITTDATGTAKATLNAGSDASNRVITVTATARMATATLTVSVTGTALTLSGPANLVLGNTGNFSVALTNSSAQGIPGAAVTLQSAKGNTLTPVSLITDASGRGTFAVKATAGGSDTVTATAYGLTQQAPLTVSPQSFNITAPANNTKVILGTPQTVTVTWLNNGVAVPNAPVTFTATRGTLVPTTPVMTDVSGLASVSISSTGAGPSIVNASGTGVTAQLSLDFVANNPSQISVQAGPATVAVNAPSTITALVRDATNNLVEGATVDFLVQTDPTNGGLSAASALTDAQGRAQTVYTAGNSTSGANGVTVKATIHGTSIASTTTLTVGGQTVFLSLGTGNTIDTGQGAAVYQITYTVFAVDSAGAALANVPVTLAVLPVAYGKGVMAGCPGGTSWGPAYSTAVNDLYNYNNTKMCRNEDTDYTGNINSLGLDINNKPIKDYNGNGKLDPGNVAVVSPGSGTTNPSGRLDVTVTYPRDHAYWVEVALVASTTVQGTQSSTTSTFVLPGAVTDYACSVGPPGPTSPYGIQGTCANPN